VFVDLGTYFRAMGIALFRRPVRLRRWLYVLTYHALFWMMWWWAAIGRALDHVLFPGFRRQPVRAPVFIVANPRSGTTLLHRLMSLDEERFLPFQLYQTLFPAIVHQRFLALLAWLDRRTGRLLERLLRRFERRVFKGWKGIHALGFNRAEEDEMLFVYTLLSPGIYLLFHSIKALRHVSFADQLPERKRRRLMRYYRGTLQRHLYANGPDKVFLDKNTLFCGRIHCVLDAFPDARVVYLVRHPCEVVPSFVSMFYTGWHAHSPDIAKDGAPSQELADVAMAFYELMLEARAELEAKGVVTVRYTELVADPKAVVERVYDRFGLPMGDALRQRLEAATDQAREYRSEHHYTLEEYGLTRQGVAARLGPVLEAYGFEP
jgi:hypothetical protein